MISLSLSVIFAFTTLGCAMWCGYKQVENRSAQGWAAGAGCLGVVSVALIFSSLILAYRFDYGTP